MVSNRATTGGCQMSGTLMNLYKRAKSAVLQILIKNGIKHYQRTVIKPAKLTVLSIYLQSVIVFFVDF